VATRSVIAGSCGSRAGVPTGDGDGDAGDGDAGDGDAGDGDVDDDVDGDAGDGDAGGCAYGSSGASPPAGDADDPDDGDFDFAPGTDFAPGVAFAPGAGDGSTGFAPVGGAAGPCTGGAG
jgi:hypothetical protein